MQRYNEVPVVVRDFYARSGTSLLAAGVCAVLTYATYDKQSSGMALISSLFTGFFLGYTLALNYVHRLVKDTQN